MWRRAFATRLPRISRTRTGSTLVTTGPSPATDSVTPPATARGPQGGHGLVGERPEVDRLAVERQRPGLCERQRPEVVEQPVHHGGLGEERRQVVLVHRVDAVEHGLDAPGDDGERRPELVGHVGEQCPPVVA